MTYCRGIYICSDMKYSASRFHFKCSVPFNYILTGKFSIYSSSGCSGLKHGTTTVLDDFTLFKDVLKLVYINIMAVF